MSRTERRSLAVWNPQIAVNHTHHLIRDSTVAWERGQVMEA